MGEAYQRQKFPRRRVFDCFTHVSAPSVAAVVRLKLRYSQHVRFMVTYFKTAKVEVFAAIGFKKLISRSNLNRG